MNLFQIAGLILIAVLLGAVVRSQLRYRTSTRSAVFWGSLWIAAAIAIIQPEVTVRIAKFLGIGRGADLIFYCGILGGLIAFYLTWLRLRRMEADLTKIVRHLAIEDQLQREEHMESKADSPTD